MKLVQTLEISFDISIFLDRLKIFSYIFDALFAKFVVLFSFDIFCRILDRIERGLVIRISKLANLLVKHRA